MRAYSCFNPLAKIGHRFETTLAHADYSRTIDPKPYRNHVLWFGIGIKVNTAQYQQRACIEFQYARPCLFGKKRVERKRIKKGKFGVRPLLRASLVEVEMHPSEVAAR